MMPQSDKYIILFQVYNMIGLNICVFRKSHEF